MPERAKNLEIAKQTVDNLNNRIWKHFPEFMRPDVEAFKANLIIGDVPKRLPMPTLYDGLKPEYAKEIKTQFDQFQMPEDTYTDHETGKTYISDYIFTLPQPLIEDFFAFQVGTFSNMKDQNRINGRDFDKDDSKLVRVYTTELCDIPPPQDKLFITRRGFERRLFFDDGTTQGKYLSDIPPKGGVQNLDQYPYLDLIYPTAFSVMTRALLNRNDDMKEFVNDLGKGSFFLHDFLGDNLNFSFQFYVITHFMDNNPWPIFDALLSGNTRETERLFHESLKRDEPDANLLQTLLDVLIFDEQIVQDFQRKMILQSNMVKQIRQYWDLKKN